MSIEVRTCSDAFRSFTGDGNDLKIFRDLAVKLVGDLNANKILKAGQLLGLFSRVKVSYENFLNGNNGLPYGDGITIVRSLTQTIVVHGEGTHWREVLSWIFLATYEACEKCAKSGIPGRGGNVFSLFRSPGDDDGSIETILQRGPFVLVVGDDKDGFQISQNTEYSGQKTWKVHPQYMGDIVERFINNTPTRSPRFVPLEGFDLKSEPHELALKLLSGCEGDDSIYSTNKKVLESIETSKNLLVHFCASRTARSFELPVDVMKIIQSELKVVMCSPENFMTVFQRRLYKAGILKLEDFLS